MAKAVIRVIVIMALIFAVYIYIKYNVWKTADKEFNILYEQDKYDQAAIVAQKELTSAEEIPYFSKFYIPPSLNNLGEVCQSQKKYVEAESYYKRSLEMARLVLKENSIEIATVLANMEKLYKETGKPEEAQKLFEQTQRIKERFK
jgi:tetratricopeptide (TPR) repeat protein